MKIILLLGILLLSAPAHAALPRGGVIQPLVFTTLANGNISSTVAGSGTYAGTAPTGIPTATWGGGCSTSSTVTGFSASAGAWSATFSTPASSGTGCTLAVIDSRGDPATSPVVTINGVNAAYPLPQASYICSTNRYVNASTGSDSYDGTSQTFTSGTTGPWATISHAETTLSGSNPGYCINVAAGTYAAPSGGQYLQCHGNTNAVTGYCVLRCAPNAATATATPWLYALTNGASGSNPVCKITNNSPSAVELGGIVASTNGATAYSYIIVDGFEVTDLGLATLTITGFSYNSGTGAVTLNYAGIAVNNMTYSGGTATLTLASNPSLPVANMFQVAGLTGTGSIASANGTFDSASGTTGTTLKFSVPGAPTLAWTSGGTEYAATLPRMCFTVSGLTGTGSIASANGYQCSQPGTGSGTIVYNIATGLTMAWSSGGTATYPSQNITAGGTVGIGQGPSNLNPNAHHVAYINNLVHDTGGACIQTVYADAWYVWKNVVYNCAWSNAYSESGIDMVQPVNATFTAGALDGQYGNVGSSASGGSQVAIHNIVANNITHNNGVPVGGVDGNGIIFDTMNGGQSSCVSPTYSYGTLAYGNIAYQNAGRGVHVFYSSNVAVYNNTSYNNALNTLSAAGDSGIDAECGSGNVVKNNIGVSFLGSGTMAGTFAAIGTGNGSPPGTLSIWLKNIFNNSGTPSPACSLQGSTGNNYACWNGRDQIYTSGTKPAAWASGTTYSGTSGNALSAVTGSDGNTYASVTSANNVGHDPTVDAPNPLTAGSWWQNNGGATNLFTDPLISSPGDPSPVWTLQATSPGLATSGADVTGLGGYSVATPNVGAQ